MKITISGTAGSGKSTVSKLLAKKLGYKHYSMGDLTRQVAQEHGMTITQWNKVESKDPKYDRSIDDRQTRIGKREDDFVMDSWLAPLFIPDSFKIFLDADIQVRAKRRLEQSRTTEKFSELNKAKQDMLSREELNQKRWKEYYGFDYLDKNNYDLVIDTSKSTPEQVVEEIIKAIDITPAL